MPKLFNIMNSDYGYYVVAGDRWDGAVYRQFDKLRPNAVWACVPVDANKHIYRFLDMRHGCHLANGYGFIVLNQHQHLDVVNVAVHEANLDRQAQWILPDDKFGYATIRNVFDNQFLCFDLRDEHVKLTKVTTPYLSWKFEAASDMYFAQPRLALEKGKPINYHVDLSNRPDYFASRVEFSEQGLLQLFGDAVGKWVKAFNDLGLEVSAQRDGEPCHINFRFGAVTHDDAGGQTPVGDVSGRFKDRTTTSTDPVTVTLRKDMNWGGGWLPATGFIDADAFEYDLRAAIAHEMGHVLGLEHCDAPNTLMRELQRGPIWPGIGESICDFDKLRLRARYVDLFFP